MSSVPGKGIFWCRGACGLREICAEHTFNEGYCLEPRERIKAVARDIQPLEREKAPRED